MHVRAYAGVALPLIPEQLALATAKQFWRLHFHLFHTWSASKCELPLRGEPFKGQKGEQKPGGVCSSLLPVDLSAGSAVWNWPECACALKGKGCKENKGGRQRRGPRGAHRSRTVGMQIALKPHLPAPLHAAIVLWRLLSLGVWPRCIQEGSWDPSQWVLPTVHLQGPPQATMRRGCTGKCGMTFFGRY